MSSSVKQCLLRRNFGSATDLTAQLRIKVLLSFKKRITAYSCKISSVIYYVYIKIRAYSKVWVINNNNNSIAAYVIAAVEACIAQNCRERKRRLRENKACL